MFKDQKSQKGAMDDKASSSNTIGKGTVLAGNLETLGNLRVDGKIVGNVKSKSKVVLGPDSIVEGNVHAQNAEIEGVVDGYVEITDLLILKTTAKIKGDIVTNKMIVESGAQFNGSCRMGDNIKERKLGENRSKTKFGAKEEAKAV